MNEEEQFGIEQFMHDAMCARFMQDAMCAREESIQRAVHDVHGVWLEDLRTEPCDDLHAGMVDILMSIVGDMSLCAQDAAMLIWLEIMNAMDHNEGVHFCTPEYHKDDE
jgi:hypothetical protein